MCYSRYVKDSLACSCYIIQFPQVSKIERIQRYYLDTLLLFHLDNPRRKYYEVRYISFEHEVKLIALSSVTWSCITYILVQQSYEKRYRLTLLLYASNAFSLLRRKFPLIKLHFQKHQIFVINHEKKVFCS